MKRIFEVEGPLSFILYREIKCDEIASLISREGLGIHEVSARLTMYEAKRALRMKKIEKKRQKILVILFLN